MLSAKASILLLVLFCLCDTGCCQVSFSTNWGSGKRSGIFSQPSDQSSVCLPRLEFNILKDLTNLVRRELRQLTKCLQENKEFEYEYTNNQRIHDGWKYDNFKQASKEKMMQTRINIDSIL